MKKYKVIDESHQRIYYEAIFEAENEEDAERKVANGSVNWKEVRSTLDDNNVSIEEIKNEHE